jgi:colanic acid/amylovoran biosynthesis glycosyltransferase
MSLNLTDHRPVVVIYKDKLLPVSQTFVRAQGEALQNYVPVYAGAHLVAGGLALPEGRWTVVNEGRWLGRVEEEAFYRWGYAPNFVRGLQHTKPVLLHCHFGPDGVRAMQLADKLGVPFLITFHGYDATITPEFAPDWRHRAFLRQRPSLACKAAKFIAVSKYIKSKLVDQGFPEEKVVVHYIGVDTNFFQADSSVRREPIVLFVGRLVEKKGCEYVIRAMARVHAVCPEARLVVIGDGPLRARLQQLARQHSPTATFLGTRSPNEVREWMNLASVFCVPSTTASNGDQEGFGLVFAEAQAMGLPVVSFASAGVPEAVANGKTGFLVPERDEEGLARNIITLFTDEQVWQRCSAAGIARVRAQFDLRRQTGALEEIYASIAGTGQSIAGEVRGLVADATVNMKTPSGVAVL